MTPNCAIDTGSRSYCDANYLTNSTSGNVCQNHVLNTVCGKASTALHATAP